MMTFYLRCYLKNLQGVDHMLLKEYSIIPVSGCMGSRR